MLRIKVPRTWQPQDRAALNESNPLARGIVAGTVGSSNVYLRGFVPYKQYITTPKVPVASGMAVRGTDDMQQIARSITIASDITLLVVGEVSSSTSATTNFAGLSHNGGTNTFTINNGNGTTAGNITGRVYLGGYRTVGGNLNAPVGSTVIAVLRHRHNVDQSLWVNGVKDTAGTTTWTGSTVGNQYWGHYSGNGNSPCTLAVAWNRALSDAEIAQLSANPWQVLEPARIWIPVSAVAGASLDIDASAVSISGALSATGDIQIGTSFDVSASAVALAGSLAATGDIEITEAPELDLDATPVALSGALTASGDIQIGTSHDLAASALALSGSLSVTGDIQIGTSFDLSAAELALSAALALSGDVESSTEVPAPAPSPSTGMSAGGGMSNVPRAKHPATVLAEEYEEAERERIRREDDMVFDCIAALVAAEVI